MYSSPTASIAFQPAAGTQTSKASFGANADTFMKLLVANMDHQDPMQPQDSGQMMNQLSQMAMVEQLTTLAETQTNASKEQAKASAVALIGKTVSYFDTQGVKQTGTVDRVEVSKDVPTLTVAGADGIDPSTVTEVA